MNERSVSPAGRPPELIPTRYAPAKRAAPRWRWYALLFAVSSPILFFLYHLISGAAASFTVVTLPGHIVLDNNTIRAEETGILSRMSVSQGDFVAKGQILAVILEPDLPAQRALLLDQMAAGSTSPVFASSGARLTIERFDAAQSHLQVMQHLQAEGAATRAETQEAQNASDTIAADIARNRDASMRLAFDNGQAMIALRRKMSLLRVQHARFERTSRHIRKNYKCSCTNWRTGDKSRTAV